MLRTIFGNFHRSFIRKMHVTFSLLLKTNIVQYVPTSLDNCTLRSAAFYVLRDAKFCIMVFFFPISHLHVISVVLLPITHIKKGALMFTLTKIANASAFGTLRKSLETFGNDCGSLEKLWGNKVLLCFWPYFLWWKFLFECIQSYLKVLSTFYETICIIRDPI